MLMSTRDPNVDPNILESNSPYYGDPQDGTRSTGKPPDTHSRGEGSGGSCGGSSSNSSSNSAAVVGNIVIISGCCPQVAMRTNIQH